jgi:predicted ATPase/DNA-binding XRE family transcriptional regulator
MVRYPSDFGKQVRALRLVAGLTQAELADGSSISERTVSDLERGVRATVFPATARQLARALKVSDEDLPGFMVAARGGPEQAVPGAERFDPPPSDYRSRLPFRLTRLIGRETELAALLRMVRNPELRLLTVVGPGGVGKTRLATEVAAITHDEFPGGTYFIDLSSVDAPDMVLASIASSVGLQPGAGDLMQSLVRGLGAGNVLLIIDTFEHLVAAAPAIGELVAACPSLTLLATSRAALHVRGERELPLQPLSVSDDKSVDSMLTPAGELFLERAESVGADLPLTPATVEILNVICARLDGLPLAIELAAPQVKHMPIGELLTHLDHRLQPLVDGPRDVPTRHQTMRGALDWSYALLGAPEMSLFRSLSTFRGGFRLEGAVAVGTAGDPPDTLPAIAALVDSSLVQVGTGLSGEARYRLLDVVREYAVERAQSAGDSEQLQQRHADYFLSVAERAEPELRGPLQQEWHGRLLEDEGNLRAALTWALEVGRGEVALRLAGALWMFWRWAGLFAEGRAWLEAALAAGDECPVATRLQGLWGAGWLAYHQLDYERTDQAGRQMLQLLTGVDDGLQRRNALTLVGNAALAEDRGEEAVAALGEALATCEERGESWHLATSLLNLGTALLHESRGAQATALFERALATYEGLGDRHFTARTLGQLGYARLVAGDSEAAWGFVDRAMAIDAELANSWSIAEGLEAVAAVSAEESPHTTAVLGGAAERLRERISMRPHPADAIINDEYMNRARARLTPEVFEIAWSEGRRTSLESALQTALTARRTSIRG